MYINVTSYLRYAPYLEESCCAHHGAKCPFPENRRRAEEWRGRDEMPEAFTMSNGQLPS